MKQRRERLQEKRRGSIQLCKGVFLPSMEAELGCNKVIVDLKSKGCMFYVLFSFFGANRNENWKSVWNRPLVGIIRYGHLCFFLILSVFIGIGFRYLPFYCCPWQFYCFILYNLQATDVQVMFKSLLGKFQCEARNYVTKKTHGFVS